MKPLAKALREIYNRPVHDGGQVCESIFNLVLNNSRNEYEANDRQFYFAEVSRQADAVIQVFLQASDSQAKSLTPITEVVEYFHASYLSLSALEAVAKLITAH